jgi:hypothetical protein
MAASTAALLTSPASRMLSMSEAFDSALQRQDMLLLGPTLDVEEGQSKEKEAPLIRRL